MHAYLTHTHAHCRLSADKALSGPRPDLDKQMRDTVKTILEVSHKTDAVNTKLKPPPGGATAVTPPKRHPKEPGLTLSFPNKSGQYELKITVQPEEQHRARYMTEGSRGAVKDKSQQGHPVVQVRGAACRQWGGFSVGVGEAVGWGGIDQKEAETRLS